MMSVLSQVVSDATAPLPWMQGEKKECLKNGQATHIGSRVRALLT